MFKKLLFAFAAILAVTAAMLITREPMASAAPSAVGTIHVALQIRQGLWEFTDTSKISGDTIFPDAVLARFPPAERSHFLAKTRRQLAEPHKERECVNQLKFGRRISSRVDGCTRSTISNTASALDIRTVCRNEMAGTRQSTEQRIAASSPTTVTSSMHAITDRGGKTMTVQTVEIGRWIAADCGKLKDNVIQEIY